MEKPSISQFIADERAAGKTDQEIIHDLLEAGWQMDIITKSVYGEPIQRQVRQPILDIHKQPIRKSVIIGGILFVIAMLLAAFA